MKLTLTATIALLAALSGVLLPLAAHADLSSTHPGYLHALSELHGARRHLQHRSGENPITMQESSAISEIDRAIGEVQKAVHDDGKNLDGNPHEDANLDRPGRLHRAVELLEKAHGDLEQEADSPEAREFKHRALDHVDRAIDAAKHAIHDAERNRDAKAS